MQILILGGTSFFGKRLVTRLLREGHAVSILTRGNSQDPFGNKVTRLRGDRNNYKELSQAIVNQHWNVVIDQTCYDADAARIACQALQNKTHRYIFTSSMSVYEPAADLKEDAFASKSYNFAKVVTTKENYAEGKRQAEAVFLQKATFPVIAVRFPIVIGEEDPTGRIQFHLRSIQTETPLYFRSLTAKISFIAAEDAAKTLAHLATSEHAQNFQGPLNAASSEPIAIKDYLAILENVCQKKAILAKENIREYRSPYGVATDYYMNTEKLRMLGLELEPIVNWAPKIAKAALL